MKKSALFLILTALLLVATACSLIPTSGTDGAANLSQTHELGQFGFSIDYPSDWLAETQGPVTVISQMEDDHNNALRGGADTVTGYQVVFDHRDLAFLRGLGLPEEASLEDLLQLNAQFFGWEQPLDTTETTLFGEPALQVQIQNQDAAGITLMGFVGDQAYLLGLDAPSEEALNEFIPTWEKMLESIGPVEVESPAF